MQTPAKRSWLRKILMIGGGLFGLLLVVALALPFLIDVDKYRPQILAAANAQINGKLELGKLTLSCWGRLKVGVDGISLADSAGRTVLAAKEVGVYVPWLSLFSGAPYASLHLAQPELVVVKDKSGKLNLLSLMKDAAPGATPAAPQVAASTANSSSQALPGFAANAHFGVEMTGARLTYQDKASGVDAKVQDLNVLVRDLSLSRQTEIEISAAVDTKVGKTVSVKGPVKLTAKGKPTLESGKFKDTTLRLVADAGGLVIDVPEAFHKKAGVVAKVEGEVFVTASFVEVKQLTAEFFNAKISLGGKVSGLQAEGSAPQLDLKASSNEIALGDWEALVPMLKPHQIKGSAKMEAVVQGTSDKPTYTIDLSAKEVSAKSPGLKATPVFTASARVVPERVSAMKLSMKAPGNDLQITASVDGFEKPRVQAAITSAGMDLDQLVEFPKGAATGSAAAKSETSASAGQTASGQAGANAADFDKAVDPLRKNPVAAATVATVKVNLKSVKAYQVKMTDLVGTLSFKGLAMSVDAFQMGLWNGVAKMTSQVALLPAVPTYRLNASVSGLELKQAVESQMELFKNTLRGKMTLSMDGQGSSFNPEPAKRNLNVKGMMKVEQATFATLDIGKMASDALNKSMGDLGNKVPALKGKTVSPPKNIASEYESVSSDFSISGGVFSAPNFFAKAAANKGLDLKGATQVGIVDYSLKADWEVIDTYNLTTAKNLSVDVMGTNVPHVLAEGDGPFRFPVSVSGQIFSPQVSYLAVPEHLGKVALKNVAKAGEERLKAEASKKVNEAAKSALQGIGKKLFGK